jgi:hypothetical protein
LAAFVGRAVGGTGALLSAGVAAADLHARALCTALGRDARATADARVDAGIADRFDGATGAARSEDEKHTEDRIESAHATLHREARMMGAPRLPSQRTAR